MESIIIWFFFAVVCAVIAPSKNRSPIAWFFLGIVGGIFSLGFLLLMKPLTLEDGKNANIVYKKCPYCSEKILVDAKICKHCKKDL